MDSESSYSYHWEKELAFSGSMSLPAQIESWMHEAISLLGSSLQHQLQQAATHRVLTVSGWNSSSAIRQAIGRYLVGLRICAIDAALSIRAEIADTDRGRLELRQNVYAIIGEHPNSLSADLIRTSRNPWIAEGLWHLCLVVARHTVPLHPPGPVVAVNLPHPKPSDHGIDVAVLYRIGDAFGFSIIESKAYPNNVGNAVQNSIVFFREVDNGTHALRIRQVISVMRAQLEQRDQDRISQTLWQERRTYFCNPHYDAQHAPNWTNPRPALAALVPGADGVFLMPHSIQSFDVFFENISAEMRAAVVSI